QIRRRRVWHLRYPLARPGDLQNGRRRRAVRPEANGTAAGLPLRRLPRPLETRGEEPVQRRPDRDRRRPAKNDRDGGRGGCKIGRTRPPSPGTPGEGEERRGTVV